MLTWLACVGVTLSAFMVIVLLMGVVVLSNDLAENDHPIIGATTAVFGVSLVLGTAIFMVLSL